MGVLWEAAVHFRFRKRVGVSGGSKAAAESVGRAGHRRQEERRAQVSGTRAEGSRGDCWCKCMQQTAS